MQSVFNNAYKAGMSKKTLTNIKALLMAFLKFCRSCKVSILFVERLFVPKGAQTKEKQILQPEDVQVLFQSDTVILKGKQVIDRYIYAYRFQVLTCLRPGEVIGLKWTDIRDGILHVARSIGIYSHEVNGDTRESAKIVQEIFSGLLKVG